MAPGGANLNAQAREHDRRLTWTEEQRNEENMTWGRSRWMDDVLAVLFESSLILETELISEDFYGGNLNLTIEELETGKCGVFAGIYVEIVNNRILTSRHNPNVDRRTGEITIVKRRFQTALGHVSATELRNKAYGHFLHVMDATNSENKDSVSTQLTWVAKELSILYFPKSVVRGALNMVKSRWPHLAALIKDTVTFEPPGPILMNETLPGNLGWGIKLTDRWGSPLTEDRSLGIIANAVMKEWWWLNVMGFAYGSEMGWDWSKIRAACVDGELAKMVGFPIGDDVSPQDYEFLCDLFREGMPEFLNFVVAWTSTRGSRMWMKIVDNFCR